ncbi:hypothetical protein [Escherichia coli]|uniref:hypothetical protein n=1 Tax=Escherichia coli TaxID=562 RepID=UPI0037DD8A15
MWVCLLFGSLSFPLSHKPESAAHKQNKNKGGRREKGPPDGASTRFWNKREFKKKSFRKGEEKKKKEGAGIAFFEYIGIKGPEVFAK